MRAEHELSFVIPAYQAAATLRACLASIRAQKKFGGCAIVVVVNGGDDGSSAVARDHGAHVVFEAVANRGLARNLGAAQCSSRWIAFVDADVTLQENWADELYTRFAQSKIPVAQGPIRPTAPRPSRLQLLREELWQERQGKMGSLLFKPGRLGPYLNSAAFIVTKAHFDLLHGFDISLPRHQDVDFGLRTTQLGGPLGFHPYAVAHVSFHGSLWDYLRRAYNVGFHRPKLWQKWLPNLVHSPGWQLKKFYASQLHRSASLLALLESTLQWLGENVGKIGLNTKGSALAPASFQRLVIGSECSLLLTAEQRAFILEADAHKFVEAKYGLAQLPHDWYEASQQLLLQEGLNP